MLLNKIFRQYDIRGKYPDDLDEFFAEKLGRSTADYLENNGYVLIGCDLRPSSQLLKTSLIRGLNIGGISTIDISPCTTDMLTFATITHKTDLAIMVTASHLPLIYNGFKFSNTKGTYLLEPEREKIRAILDNGNFRSGIGKNEEVSVIEPYLKSMKKLMNWDSSTLSGAKIAVYPMGGSAKMTTPVLLQELGAEVTTLSHAPVDLEPREDNTVAVEKEIREKNLTLGVINDGDGDRLAARCADGSYISGDQLLCLFAKTYSDIGKVVVTIDSSSAVFDYVGKDLLISKVGEANYVNDALSNGAVFGGEPSGHFVDLRFTPSGSGAIFAGILAKKALDSDLKNIINEIPKYHTFRVKIGCEDRIGFMKKLFQKFDREHDNMISQIDGIKYRSDSSTILIRPSNTESVVRSTIESKNADEARTKTQEIKELLQKLCV